MPRVTVGVPVYNGVALIRECLECLANQTYDDFEVIISDNASTDGTSEICAEFATKDKRFRHVLRSETYSANNNFLWVRDFSDCEYFAYRAYDDLSDPDFLERLAQILDLDPRTRLAVGAIRKEVGTYGKVRFHPYPITVEVEKAGVLPRLLQQMFHGHASWFYGLWRIRGLAESYDRVIRDYDDPWGCDHLILLHAMFTDGIRGSQSGATFVQRILPTDRHYLPNLRPDYATMVARNRLFESVAKGLLEESELDRHTKAVLVRMLPKFTLFRCHSAKRLFQARLKSLFKKC
jgi:glycosyltransferase involved in cell wall biosynthesis